MRISFIIAAAVLPLAVAVGPSQAQERVRPNQRFCLEVRVGDNYPTLMCRFETWEQCMQSRTSPMETCFVNPRLANPGR